MRIRTVKPQFFTHEELSGLPADTHLLAAGLLCYADDEGYFLAHPDLVKAAIFPLRACSVSSHDMITDLSRIGFVRLGTGIDGKRYGQVVKFSEHQVVNRPLPSKIMPKQQIVWDDSPTTHGGLTESSLPEVEVEVEVERELEGEGGPGETESTAPLFHAHDPLYDAPSTQEREDMREDMRLYAEVGLIKFCEESREEFRARCREEAEYLSARSERIHIGDDGRVQVVQVESNAKAAVA